jgi:hypothetical protein
VHHDLIGDNAEGFAVLSLVRHHVLNRGHDGCGAERATDRHAGGAAARFGEGGSESAAREIVRESTRIRVVQIDRVSGVKSGQPVKAKLPGAGLVAAVFEQVADHVIGLPPSLTAHVGEHSVVDAELVIVEAKSIKREGRLEGLIGKYVRLRGRLENDARAIPQAHFWEHPSPAVDVLGACRGHSLAELVVGNGDGVLPRCANEGIDA